MLDTSYFLTALMALGMAWAFMRADPESGTSRALVLTLAMMGFAIVASPKDTSVPCREIGWPVWPDPR